MSSNYGIAETAGRKEGGRGERDIETHSGRKDCHRSLSGSTREQDILTLQKETSRAVKCGNSHTNGGRDSRSELFRSERRLRTEQKGL